MESPAPIDRGIWPAAAAAAGLPVSSVVAQNRLQIGFSMDSGDRKVLNTPCGVVGVTCDASGNIVATVTDSSGAMVTTVRDQTGAVVTVATTGPDSAGNVVTTLIDALGKTVSPVAASDPGSSLVATTGGEGPAAAVPAAAVAGHRRQPVRRRAGPRPRLAPPAPALYGVWPPRFDHRGGLLSDHYCYPRFRQHAVVVACQSPVRRYAHEQLSTPVRRG
jgi:hypothetical protein